jgi:arylsulfatase A-like enzyme
MGRKHRLTAALARHVVPAAALAWLTGAVTDASAAERCKDCNLLLVSIDTLRADRLGAYGYRRGTSPRIDLLARKSLVFENAVSSAPWTLPSHTAMLTGVEPVKLGIELHTDRVPAEAVTLAEVLAGRGYATGAISTGAFVAPEYGFDQGFESFLYSLGWQDASELPGRVGAWLDANRGRRFFLFVHTFHVHDPYAPAASAARLVDPGYTGNLQSYDIPQIVKLNTGQLTLPPNELARISSLYDAEILEIDGALGAILDRLAALGLDRKTVVIVTSDHGEEFGERGSYGLHAYSLYDELLRVPLLIHVPQGKAGRVADPVGLVDIYPTALDLLGVRPPAPVDGQSVLAVPRPDRCLRAETTIPREAFLANAEAEYRRMESRQFRILERPRSSAGTVAKVRMARRDSHKLIRNRDGSPELYDLAADPGERTNLAGKGSTEEAALISCLGEPPTAQPGPAPPPR